MTVFVNGPVPNISSASEPLFSLICLKQYKYKLVKSSYSLRSPTSTTTLAHVVAGPAVLTIRAFHSALLIARRPWRPFRPVNHSAGIVSASTGSDCWCWICCSWLWGDGRFCRTGRSRKSVCQVSQDYHADKCCDQQHHEYY
jgi:hypothetical protein